MVMAGLLYLGDGDPLLCCHTQALKDAVVDVAEVADDKL